jgi:pyridoxine 5-phosphate synthase
MRCEMPMAKLMEPWRPQFELNVEGYPNERFFEIIRKVRPEQCTLVPDAPDTFTSQEGWKLDNHDTGMVSSAVEEI